MRGSIPFDSSSFNAQKISGSVNQIPSRGACMPVFVLKRQPLADDNNNINNNKDK
jgi:hypothetical protein